MRISDWSSDVCSSDLNYCQGHLEFNNYGRDHHPRAFSMWMAGGGVKPGIAYGETDEFGYNIVKDPVHIHDFHATVLHLLGLDQERLTFKHLGRSYRLTGVAGQVGQELMVKNLAPTEKYILY